MKRAEAIRWTRNRFLRVVVIAPAAYVLAACTGKNGESNTAAPGEQAAAPSTSPAASDSGRTEPTRTATTGPAMTQSLPPTPECDDRVPTVEQTEGPYFTPNSPERTSLLEPGISGTRLVVAGFVLSTECQPVEGALVDFWQCDDAGEYDNEGYRLRGHQFTDENGRYQLETIVPGLYPGRTRHIHVKVQAPNRPVVTTQQYFPDEPRNRGDGIFNQALVMDVQDTPDGKSATFDYVLNLS